MLNLGQNWQFVVPCDLEIWCMTLKTIGHIFNTTSSFVHHFKAVGEFKLELQSANPQFGSKSAIFFVRCDLEIWWMTLKNNRAPLLCCLKLCALLHSHQWIQTRVTVRKHPIWVKIDVCFSVPCDLEIWQMTLNKANLRDLIAATGLVILLKMDQNRQFFSLCDLKIWWMTPKNNRAPLLCYFKLFASFRSHWWI